MGVVIINMTNGIVHLVRYLLWSQLAVWTTLTVIVGILAGILSWQILQLIDQHRINYGFQLGGLWVIITFLLDFFIYILPQPGTVTDVYARLSNKLLVYYGILLIIPTLAGIVQTIQNQERI
ncbi:MAG: hypothetical protein MAGBODY4_00453 [Candidatus Marinimicrobia bacterium]|nr:hypothetical protein [Candidatus Neomarinimicrobiota bacterium]